MSITLNGTSQYVSLGNAVNIRSATPILVAIVVDSTSLPSATRGLLSQGDYNANTGFGAFAYGAPPKLIGGYEAPSGQATAEQDGNVANIPADDGWYLVCLAFYTTGSAPNITLTLKVQIYSYTHATWGTEESPGGVAGLSLTTLTAPAVGETTVIGANLIGTIKNFWSGNISWIAVFNNNGGAGATQIKDTAIAAELIANGFWNLLDGNCALAIAFNGAAIDQSGNGHDGTLIGSPSYGPTGPGESPSSDITGTLSVTQAANTIAADGSVAITGDLSITQDAETTAAGGQTLIVADLNVTQAGQVLTANEATDIIGVLNITQAANTLSSVGGIPGTITDMPIATIQHVVAQAVIELHARPVATIAMR